MGVAADLYAENDWRVLWWEVLVRSQTVPNFPASVEDAEWVAFACDSVVRHLRDPFLRQLEPLAERARSLLVFACDAFDGARQLVTLVDNYLRERRNPIFAMTVHAGPWSADPSTVLRNVTELMPPLDESLHDGLRQCTVVARKRTWIEPRLAPSAKLEPGKFRTRPSVRDLIGFANYDLRNNECPEIEIDPTGRLFVDGLSDRGSYTLAVRILRYHGFVIYE